MKFGYTMFLEFKNNWRGLLIFLLLVAIIIGGMIQTFPSMTDAFDQTLEGQENVDIDIVKYDEYANVSLVWYDNFSWVNNYTLKIGLTPQMLTPEDVVYGLENNSYVYRLDLEEGNIPERYFVVVAEGLDQNEFVGIETNVEKTNPFEEIWGIDYGDVRGVISMFWGMFFVLLIGIYIGYLAVNSISKDFDERRMDIILSQPISRRQYFLEKISMVSIYTLFVLLIVSLVSIASVHSLGELDSVSASTLFLTTMLSWPVFLVIISVCFLVSIFFENSKKALGFGFLFVLFMFGIQMVSDLTEGLEYLKTFTIISYWNHESLFYGESINWMGIGFLLALFFIILFAALTLFEKKDITG